MKKIISTADKLVLFIGGPRHKVLSLIIEEKIPIEQVYFPDNENPRLDVTKEICLQNKIPTKKIKKSEIHGEIPDVYNKVCLSLGFPYLFPKSFLNQTRFVINVHGTLLPKYRGASTLNWAIENGDKESGVTVHFVDEGCDTGDIILQKSFPLSVFETGKSLYRKTLEFEPHVVLEALKALYDGSYNLTSQKGLESQCYPNRKPHHSELDQTQPLSLLYNKIRAADPIDYPAYFYINGEKVCIKIWRETKAIEDQDLI